MQRLFHRSLKSKNRIQMYFCYIKLGPRLYWLIRNFEIQKLFWVLKKIIAVFLHSLFYNCFKMQCTSCIHCILPKSHLYPENTPTLASWNTTRTCLSSSVLLVFDSIQVIVVNYSSAELSLLPKYIILIMLLLGRIYPLKRRSQSQNHWIVSF
jgi:hypothetical protein